MHTCSAFLHYKHISPYFLFRNAANTEKGSYFLCTISAILNTQTVCPAPAKFTGLDYRGPTPMLLK